MTSIDADIALLTERRYAAAVADQGDWYVANILREDQLLSAELAKRGVSTVRLDWSRPDVDWSRYRLAVFRSTWDYFDRFAEFREWFACVRLQTRLCNDATLVEWNMDKRYLADLQRSGVPTVPTRFLERGSQPSLRAMLDAFDCREGVIKPCVSGAARYTYRIDRDNAAEIDAAVTPLLVNESFLVQPFQNDVLRNGETTLVVLNGKVTHGVRKTPKPGDFRVQDDHGGVAKPHQPTAEEIELAEAAMSACPGIAAYGRVDMVRENAGSLAIMELELIEPELWLRHHPPAAAAFADAIVAQLR